MSNIGSSFSFPSQHNPSPAQAETSQTPPKPTRSTQAIRAEMDPIAKKLEEAYRTCGFPHWTGNSRSPTQTELISSALFTRSTPHGTFGTVNFKDEKSGRPRLWNINLIGKGDIEDTARTYKELQDEFLKAEFHERGYGTRSLSELPPEVVHTIASNLSNTPKDLEGLYLSNRFMHGVFNCSHKLQSKLTASKLIQRLQRMAHFQDRKRLENPRDSYDEFLKANIPPSQVGAADTRFTEIDAQAPRTIFNQIVDEALRHEPKKGRPKLRGEELSEVLSAALSKEGISNTSPIGYCRKQDQDTRAEVNACITRLIDAMPVKFQLDAIVNTDVMRECIVQNAPSDDETGKGLKYFLSLTAKPDGDKDLRADAIVTLTRFSGHMKRFPLDLKKEVIEAFVDSAASLENDSAASLKKDSAATKSAQACADNLWKMVCDAWTENPDPEIRNSYQELGQKFEKLLQRHGITTISGKFSLFSAAGTPLRQAPWPASTAAPS